MDALVAIGAWALWTYFVATGPSGAPSLTIDRIPRAFARSTRSLLDVVAMTVATVIVAIALVVAGSIIGIAAVLWSGNVAATADVTTR